MPPEEIEILGNLPTTLTTSLPLPGKFKKNRDEWKFVASLPVASLNFPDCAPDNQFGTKYSEKQDIHFEREGIYSRWLTLVFRSKKFAMTPTVEWSHYWFLQPRKLEPVNELHVPGEHIQENASNCTQRRVFKMFLQTYPEILCSNVAKTVLTLKKFLVHFDVTDPPALENAHESHPTIWQRLTMMEIWQRSVNWWVSLRWITNV